MTDANVEFHEVGNEADIEEEGAIQVTVGKTDIAIYRLEGALYASDDICTHAYVHKFMSIIILHQEKTGTS